jgi:hypothetical protein
VFGEWEKDLKKCLSILQLFSGKSSLPNQMLEECLNFFKCFNLMRQQFKNTPEADHAFKVFIEEHFWDAKLCIYRLDLSVDLFQKLRDSLNDNEFVRNRDLTELICLEICIDSSSQYHTVVQKLKGQLLETILLPALSIIDRVTR